MFDWFGKLFGKGRTQVSRTMSQQVQKVTPKIAPKIAPKVESETCAKVQQNVNSAPIGRQLSYGKWYYGVDENAQPVVKRFTGGIEKRYPCKDGGELVVTYVSRGDKSSSLRIAKTGNPKDANRGDWYRSFCSDTAVKHYTDRFGTNVSRTVKKKSAIKQSLSCQNGRVTEDVYVPLKRWERSSGLCGKKKVSYINPWNPRDFERFCD